MRPFFPQGDFLRARNGAFDAIKPRMACTSALLPCALRAAPRRRGFSIAVGSALGVHQLRRNRWHLENNQPNLWSKVGWLRECIRLLGHPKTFPEGKVPTDVGGRGNAVDFVDRGTNGDGIRSCVFSSSVSASAATFLVVANSISFVLPLGGKSSVVPLCPEEIPLGDSSSPHQTH